MMRKRSAMANKKSVTLSPEAVELASKLTKLQRQIVIGVVSGKRHRQAYYDAGGKAKSDDSADATVSEILNNPKCLKFKAALLESVSKTAVMTREEALERLSILARVTVKDVAIFRKAVVGEDEGGEPVQQSVWEIKDSGDIGDEQAAAISEISAGRDGIKFKLHSSAAAIKQLADMEGWNAARKYEHTGKDGKPMEVISVDITDEDAVTAYMDMIKRP